NIEIYVSGGSISAGDYGISASEQLAGDVFIRLFESAEITIDPASGTLDPTTGISARETGLGKLIIVAEGDITAGIGIDANESDDPLQSNASGAIEIDASGTIVATTIGIRAVQNVNSPNGSINITSSGTIDSDGTGIKVGSFAPTGTADVMITAGSVDGDNIGVDFSESVAGSANTLSISAGASLTTASGTAVQGGAGSETVVIAGLVTGAVNLAAADDVVEIETTADIGNATFDGGDGEDTLRLTGDNGGAKTLSSTQQDNFEVLEKTGNSTWTLDGDHEFTTSATISGGMLSINGMLTTPSVVNEAMLSPGDRNQVDTKEIQGNLRQTATGTYVVDIDVVAQSADRLDVTGVADLAGTVQLDLGGSLSAVFPDMAFGVRNYTILTATGGVTTANLGLVAPVSPAMNASLQFPNATDVRLAFGLDYTVPGRKLNRNQLALAHNLNRAFISRSGGLNPVLLALITGPTTMDQYRASLDVLLPEVYLNTQTAMLFSANDFMSDLFSCPTADDGAAFMHEGQCVWVRPKGRKLDRDDTAEAIGYEDTVGGVSAGAQFNFAPGWVANVGASYESGTLKTDTAARSESDRYHLGGAVKYEVGPWLFAGAVAGGIGDFDTTRQIAFTGFNETATSDHDVSYIAGQLRVAYQFAMPGWYVRPLVDVNLTYLDRDGVTETGAGTANLKIDSGKETVFSATPAVEIGGTYEIIPGTTFKPFLMAGVTLFADDDHSLTSAFTLAPDTSFETTTEHGDVFGNVHAGMTLVGGTSDFNFTLGYKGLYSDDVTQHGVYAKGAWMLN
ncbi:MAG: autotransporter domain-containing protein, partial [Pseudomonadota bacterium]